MPRKLFAGTGVEELSSDTVFGRARDGDRWAYEILYDRYATDLFEVCRLMLGEQGLAQAALEETFETAFRALKADADIADQLDVSLARIAIDVCVLILEDTSLENIDADIKDEIKLLNASERAVYALSKAGMGPQEIGDVLQCGTAEAGVRLANAHLALAA